MGDGNVVFIFYATKALRHEESIKIILCVEVSNGIPSAKKALEDALATLTSSTKLSLGMLLESSVS